MSVVDAIVLMSDAIKETEHHFITHIEIIRVYNIGLIVP